MLSHHLVMQEVLLGATKVDPDWLRMVARTASPAELLNDLYAKLAAKQHPWADDVIADLLLVRAATSAEALAPLKYGPHDLAVALLKRMTPEQLSSALRTASTAALAEAFPHWAEEQRATIIPFLGGVCARVVYDWVLSTHPADAASPAGAAIRRMLDEFFCLDDMPGYFGLMASLAAAPNENWLLYCASSAYSEPVRRALILPLEQTLPRSGRTVSVASYDRGAATPLVCLPGPVTTHTVVDALDVAGTVHGLADHIRHATLDELDRFMGECSGALSEVNAEALWAYVAALRPAAAALVVPAEYAWITDAMMEAVPGAAAEARVLAAGLLRGHVREFAALAEDWDGTVLDLIRTAASVGQSTRTAP